MNPKISIIVPVYNVEKYLCKCLDSILNQSFDEFELILIDDGSTDNSGDICDFYAKKDQRVIVMHKKNEGQAIARNKGINISRGKYLGFVDSDDWIEKDMYKNLYEKAIVENLDIAIIGVREINEEGICINEYVPDGVSLAEIIRRAYPCNKLFKKILFEENELYFKEGMYYEDLELIPKLFLKSDKINYINKSTYNYLRRQNSTTTTRDEKIIDNLLAYIELKNYLLKEGLYLKYEQEFKECIRYFKRYYLNMLYDYPSSFLIKNIRVIICNFYNLGEKEIGPFINLFIKHINFVIKINGLKVINNIKQNF